jgi:hypothetical protein
MIDLRSSGFQPLLGTCVNITLEMKIVDGGAVGGIQNDKPL